MLWYKKFQDRSREILEGVRNKNLINLILILNLFDIITTIFVIEFFGGVELNPLMAALLSTHPVVFVIVKIFILQFIIGLVILSELKGGKIPALKIEFYLKENHYIPKWFWLSVIGIFLLTLLFNLSMIFLGLFIA